MRGKCWGQGGITQPAACGRSFAQEKAGKKKAGKKKAGTRPAWVQVPAEVKSPGVCSAWDQSA